MNKIICKFRGRLGNHMFIIAFGEALSKRYNLPVYYIKNRRNNIIDFSFLNKAINIIENFDYNNHVRITHPNQLEYEDIHLNVDDDKTLEFDGLWLSDKYFGKELAFELFGIKDEVKNEIKRLYPDIENYASIHIRRTDFLVFNKIYKTLTIEEINKAISNFDKGQKFLIISDDLDWCKETFKDYDNFIYTDKASDIISKELLDLYSMTLCKDNIISNSTFSWWGAYLNIHKDRKVYYSEPWQKNKDKSFDVIPENDNWVAIDTLRQ